MRSFRVILAEDNPDHQDLLIRRIEEGGELKCVGVARSGQDLRDLVSHVSFDCLVSDFHLEDGEACTILDAIRAQLGGRPVIMVTSRLDQRPAVEAFRAGCVDFLPKSEALCSTALRERVTRAIHAWRTARSGSLRNRHRETVLRDQLEIDPLTGLQNRACLQRLRDEIASGKDQRRPSCCILLDLDHFKKINDQHGHDVGDQVLVATAKTLREMISNGDIAMRIGGEEFLILRREDDLLQNLLWMECLREAIGSHTIEVKTGIVRPTVSAGVVVIQGAAHTPDAVHSADESLYLAKRQGRNRYCTDQMVTVLREASNLHQSCPLSSPLDLRRALLKILLPQTGTVHRNHLVEHSELVGMSAYSLALRMTGSQEDAARIRLAGLFHDAGKVYVPERLLAKIGPLTESEIALLSTHAGNSAEIVAALTGDMEVANIVRSHHVRFDAMPSSQPLPIEWQVLPIADAWEAMISGREYKKPMPIENAIEELRMQRGLQFSPLAVDAWIEMQANRVLAA